MNRTLPLFESLEVPRPQVAKASRRPPVDPAARAAATPTADNPDRHLRAAWRLSRGMWRYPDHSPEQTKAGLAICRHLQALLTDADPEAGRGHGQR